MTRFRLLLPCLFVAALTQIQAQSLPATTAAPVATTSAPAATAPVSTATPAPAAPAAAPAAPIAAPAAPIAAPAAPAAVSTAASTPAASVSVPLAAPASVGAVVSLSPSPAPVPSPLSSTPVSVPVPAASLIAGANTGLASASAGPTGPTGPAGPAGGQVWSAAVSLPAKANQPNLFAAPTGVNAATTGPLTLLLIPENCTASNLNVVLAGSKADPANASALTVTLVALDSDPVNPSPTELTCSVINPASPSMTSCSDATHRVALHGGMLIGLSFGPFSSPAEVSAFLPSTVYASFTCQ